MKISSKQYAQALYELTKGKEESVSEKIIKEFVTFLINKNEVSKLDKIIRDFAAVWNKNESLAEAEITSAREIDSRLIENLNGYTAQLKKVKKVKSEKKIDKELLGGVVIRCEDMIIDASLKAKLKDIKESMLK